MARLRVGDLGGARLARLTLFFLAVWAVAALADELDDYLRRQQDVYQIPAIVVGVIQDGELVDSRAVGLANVDLDVRPGQPGQIADLGEINARAEIVPRAVGAVVGRMWRAWLIG